MAFYKKKPKKKQATVNSPSTKPYLCDDCLTYQVEALSDRIALEVVPWLDCRFVHGIINDSFDDFGRIFVVVDGRMLCHGDM